MKKPTPTTVYLRKQQVAERYNIHERSVDRLSRQGSLPMPHYLHGSRFPLWKLEELDAFDRKATRTRPAPVHATA
jgi:hypothetical protein